MTGVQELIDRSIPFLEVVKNRTAGAELELRLNGTYGPGSALYDDLARMIRYGVRDGWAANIEVDGRRYRRSRLAEPSAELNYFSVTAVYGQRRAVSRAVPSAPVRRAQPSRAAGRRREADRAARLERAGLDGSGTGQPPLSGGQGRRAHRTVLPAGRISYDFTPPAD